MLYRVMYKCAFLFASIGGIVILLNYLHDFINFLRNKITNGAKHEDWNFVGKMFIAIGIFCGGFGFMLSFF